MIEAILVGLWNGFVMQVWYILCILGLLATVLGAYDTLTKDRDVND